MEEEQIKETKQNAIEPITSAKDIKDHAKNEERHKADNLWKFLAGPHINPIELHILMTLYKQSFKSGIKFTTEQLRFTISYSIYLSQLSYFDFADLPKTYETYIDKLTSHYFLNYDPKLKCYFLTKPANILGKALVNLQDTEFQHYDSKYLENIVINIREILENWRSKLDKSGYMYPPFTADRLGELCNLLKIFLQKEQQIMNISQLEIHIFDLNQQSIIIVDQLKIVINQIQISYIEGIHQKKDISNIKLIVQKRISEFKSKIDQLNRKSHDINDLIKKNEKNLKLILELADNLYLEFENLYNIYYSLIVNHKEKISSLISKLMELCQKLEDFTYQFKLTTFEIIINRVNNIQHLFNYFKDLIQNTQLQGDLYLLWKYCIYGNIRDNNQKKISDNILQAPNLLDSVINKIPIEEFSINQLQNIEKKQLDYDIKSRNQTSNDKYIKELKKTREKLKEIKGLDTITDEIVNKIKNLNGPIDIASIIFEFCRKTRFKKSIYFPRIISIVWQKLLKVNDRDLKINCFKPMKESNAIFEFEDKNIIRVKNLLVKINEWCDEK